MARYHPISDGLWNDARFEGVPFYTRAFFAYLSSNQRLNPSGIYRVTDAQLAADTELPIKVVQGHLERLVACRAIVRDGGWLFVRKYLKRQPKSTNMLLAAEKVVSDCESPVVLESFSETYPHLRQWSDNRLATVAERLANLPTLRAEQSRAEQSRTKTTGGTADEALNGHWGEPEHLANLYNDCAPDECPSVTLPLSPGRRTKLREYLKAFPDEAWWREVFAQVHASPFLRGKRRRDGQKPFTADLDWLLTKGKADQVENAAKVHDGRYRDG